jgi:hypothetical protein
VTSVLAVLVSVSANSRLTQCYHASGVLAKAPPISRATHRIASALHTL